MSNSFVDSQLDKGAAVYSCGVDVTECVNTWLKASRISQAEVARQAGINPGKLNEIVKGRTSRGNRPDPQFSTVEKIARGFGISVVEFLRGPRPEQETGLEKASAEEIERRTVLEGLYERIIEKYPTADETWRGDVQRAQAAVADAAVALARALRRANEDFGPAPPDTRKTGS